MADSRTILNLRRGLVMHVGKMELVDGGVLLFVVDEDWVSKETELRCERKASV